MGFAVESAVKLVGYAVTLLLESVPAVVGYAIGEIFGLAFDTLAGGDILLPT